jgi:thiol-disulfide isomerase/thioredoxin
MKLLKNLFAVSAFVGMFAIASLAQASFTTLDGTRVNVEAQPGKVVILAVGASWLPLSDKQAEFTNVLSKRYSGKPVVVYFIATDSTNARSKNYATNDSIAKFVASSKLAVPVLRDSEGSVVLRRYSLDQLPSFVILDKTGKQAGEAFGGIDPKYDVTITISKAVDKLL